jgi:glucose-1-phosphatase
VLAAIGANDYSLPETIEKKTPIGSKLVIEKWAGNDGKMYAAVNLCYQSLDQLRHLQLLSLENTPTVFSVPIEGLTANEDGLYLLDDLTARLGECIAQYDELLTGIASTRAVAQNDGTRAKIFKLDGTPADEETRGIVIDNGKKKVVK